MANSLTPTEGHLVKEPPLAEWLLALSRDRSLERSQANALRGAPAPQLAALPSLLSLLKDSDPNIRLQAVSALGDMGAEVRRVLPKLHAALQEAASHDAHEGVRAEAVHALLQAGPQPVTEVAALVDALHSEVDVMRFHAAITLGDLGPAARPAVAALIHTALWDNDPAVRVEAGMALWKIDRKGPLVLHVLVKALEDANELICWIAAERLAQLGPAAREAAPALRQALHRDFKISLIKKAVLLALECIDPQQIPKNR